MNKTKIPLAIQELGSDNRWVVWRWEERQNKRGEVKRTKPPLAVKHGRPVGYAKNNDPATWTSLEDALAAAEHADGVGMQLMGLKGVAAIDLDNVRKPDGDLLPWVEEAIRLANSYAEFTPSGKGARIIGRVALDHPTIHTKIDHPGGGHFEVYANLTEEHGRYITVTGDAITGAPDALADITEVLGVLMAVQEGSQKEQSFLGAGFVIDPGKGSIPDKVFQLLVGNGTGDRSRDFQSIVGTLKGHGWSVENILQLLEDHPNGPAQKYEGRLEAEVRRSWNKASPTQSGQPQWDDAASLPDEPIPLIRDNPEPAPYPIEALGPLQDAAVAISRVTEAPIALCAASVLATAALACQGHRNAETLSGTAPASLFLMTIAESGERKSTADRLAMRGVRAFEAECRNEYELAKGLHSNAVELWSTERKKILSGKGKGGTELGAIEQRADLDALGPEPSAPLKPQIATSSPTIEGIMKNLPYLRASLGIMTEEGGALIGGHSMKAENRLATCANLSAMWDGQTLDRWRAGDGVESYSGRRFSAHILVQPVAAETLLADRMATGQGLIARFLTCRPTSNIGTRLRMERDVEAEDEIDRFEGQIRYLLSRVLPLKEGKANELDPPTLQLSSTARQVLTEFAKAIETAQAPGNVFEDVRAFASKAAEHAARIAAVLTIYRDPDAASVTGEIMAGAVEIARFYANEAKRLSEAAVIPTDVVDAQRMRSWLIERWPEDYISQRAAVNHGPFKDSGRTTKAIKSLVQHGWLRQASGVMVSGHKCKNAWLIVRGGM